jgi:hypothetical protein
MVLAIAGKASDWRARTPGDSRRDQLMADVGSRISRDQKEFALTFAQKIRDQVAGSMSGR